MNKAMKLRRQRNGKIHRTEEGVYYRYAGYNRFTVVTRNQEGGWSYSRVERSGDFEDRRPERFGYESPIVFPTYRAAFYFADGEISRAHKRV